MYTWMYTWAITCLSHNNAAIDSSLKIDISSGKI